MLILAHRGYHAELPKNTLEAFEAAVNLDVDGIETDVQVTSDGVPILFHDTTIQEHSVTGLTHSELCRLSRCKVPTLVSALEAWPDLFWNLEIKSPERFPLLLRALREYQGKCRLLVSSFLHPIVVAVGWELDVECGLLVAHQPLSAASFLVGWPDDIPRSRVSIVLNIAGADKEVIHEATALGLKSYVYGDHTEDDPGHLALWGVEGLITDNAPLASRPL